ncbi:complex I intermediate-associated protein 30 (CIA30) [Rhodovulum bhavnagarense]|uniref:Complex I intermediate-associated protein 30 (CIA30) n=1 Tax=Rhodovulum bhavnagarense TaxID=992286 RepID=A0A4R2RJR4_9RHOB|nr:CIA30 family protein [Rhodovulum bhavnagarense]TCP62769.1 complex I intermediate-associated protein 30 (CIA30) [Rhodovulum bhavnagarense]
MADTVLDPITRTTAPAWSFLSDRVMGGVSQGLSAYAEEGGTGFLRLTGDVSTANRGGFIQMRRDIRLPAEAEGLILRVRGNGQRYFVHLRMSGIKMPWQFYQAPFETTADWREIRIPLSAFKPSGGFQRPQPEPGRVNSLGIAAYGRDHHAEVALSSLSYY